MADHIHSLGLKAGIYSDAGSNTCGSIWDKDMNGIGSGLYVLDYFNIKELRLSGNAEDYFYKARKLFRYFPENRKMIKEITAGALEIMNDVSRLKVIQLWAGKTVESKSDFDAIYNYVKISQKCGFNDIAKKYATFVKC